MSREQKTGWHLLVSFEVLVFNSGVVLLDPKNGFGTIFGGKEFGMERAIWEEKPDGGAKQNRCGPSYDLYSD